MTRRSIVTVASLLAAVGTIFMLTMAFELLDTKIALFLGVSFYVLSGTAYATAARYN